MSVQMDVRVLELPLRHAWTIARGTSTSKRNVIVELREAGERGPGAVGGRPAGAGGGGGGGRGRCGVIKVRLGARDGRETFGAVRAATSKPVRVDANEAWKPEEALAHIEWLAAQGVELVEQPLPAADVEGAKWLRQRSPLPLVADEALMMASEVPRLAEGYHGINVKLQKCGGIREALRIIETARACGLKVMIGCMVETGVGIAAAAHLGPLADWLDLDGNLLLSADPFQGHPVVDGRIRLGEGPGLGVEPRLRP